MSESAPVTFWINGVACTMPAGSVVSAAMLSVGVACRTSVSGESRTALCGMGICFECRAVVDGVPHQRTCQLLCREGMRVETQS
jgi:sarcosine oxidase subunit alpha